MHAYSAAMSSPRIKIKPGTLHAECKARDISRADLARRMGVSEATAYRIDDGRTDPSPKFIAALMEISGKAFEDLFDIVRDQATEPAESVA